MSGCDWNKPRFSVAMESKITAVCSECNAEIEAVTYLLNGSPVCLNCWRKKKINSIADLNEFSTTKDRLYEFIDTKNFGKPVEVHGKKHWKKLLKESGLTDDFTQDPKEHAREVRNRKDDYKPTDRKFIKEQIMSELQGKGLYHKMFRKER